MYDRGKYTAKYLWRLGNTGILGMVIGTPFFLLGILKIAKLYEINLGFDERQHLFISLVIVILLVAFAWGWFSQKWKKWALQNIKKEDRRELECRIDGSDSFVLKKWNELNKPNLIFRVVIIVILIVGAFYGDWNRHSTDRLFADKGQSTVATILKISTKYKKKRANLICEYRYIVNDIEFEDEKTLNTGYFLFREEVNGFPIEAGDQFALTYIPDGPVQNRLDLRQPKNQTLEKYIKLSQSKQCHLANQSKCSCILEAVYNTFGIDGLAVIFNKDKSYWENKNYNQIKYELLTNKTKFQTITYDCSSKEKTDKPLP